MQRNKKSSNKKQLIITKNVYLVKKHMQKMNVIRSHNHEIFSETVNKIALSADDDKRIILDDGISTLAFGNKMLPK